MPAQALAAVATLLSFAPHGNHVEFRLDRGSAELVWVSDSTFRFRRTLDGPLPAVRWVERKEVPTETDDAAGAVRMRSKYLEVTVQKHGLLLRVRKVDGTPLLADVSEPQQAGSGVAWERQSPAGARFYGLGPRADPSLDLRGKAVDSDMPFLVTTAGYGEFHAAGPARFDFTAADRYRIEAPAVDYFIYYGPTVKEIFEEHQSVRGRETPWAVAAGNPATWEGLRASLLRLVHGAMSAALDPAFDLTPFANAPPELAARARQLGSLVRTATPGAVGLSDFRRQLKAFFESYVPELQDKGYPTWHPLPFQFPDDAECARHADEFMLGDEMLVAPVYQPGRKRSLYLPQGLWTELETNQVFPGRRTITVETAALPVFARNGMIVPLDSEGGMALHYFPTLAAEFFLLESDIGDYSQVHAAPADDIMRLQIESKKERTYQWVVHHIERPSAVGFGGRKYRPVAFLQALADRSWFYDAAQKNLHVRVRVAAGEDSIINLEF